MQNIKNVPTGICAACDSNCATCSSSPTFCMSCASGFYLSGLKCISSQNVNFNISFSSPTATSSSSELSAFMIILEDIR